jgi:hypothetical protein
MVTGRAVSINSIPLTMLELPGLNLLVKGAAEHDMTVGEYAIFLVIRKYFPELFRQKQKR